MGYSFQEAKDIIQRCGKKIVSVEKFGKYKTKIVVASKKKEEIGMSFSVILERNKRNENINDKLEN